MLDNILVSIIIPVYNSEHTLQGCLNSVISQTWNNIEIIIVDDGSTDNSYSICQSYAQSDYRIRVFRQLNSGPGAARNVGLQVAKGDYIYFVDSDDVIDRNLVETMVISLEHNHCSLGFLNYRSNKAVDKKIRQIFSCSKISSKDKILELLLPDVLPSYTWIFFAKKELYMQPYQIKFTGRRLREDQSLLYILVSRSNCVYIESSILYNYRIHDDSLLGRYNLSLEMADSMLQLAKERYSYFKNTNFFQMALQANLSLLLDAYSIYYENNIDSSFERKKVSECYNLIVEYVHKIGIFHISFLNLFKYMCVRANLIRFLLFLKRLKRT